MKVWSFYNKETGLFMGKTYSGPDELMELHKPINAGFIEGNYDYLSQKIDLATREVIDYQPPAPSTNHEWSIDSKRWALKPEVAASQRDIASAKAAITQLEGQQARAVRELILGPTNADAIARLSAIDDQIAIQRAIIVINSNP